jgi:phosphatidylinositol alpha-1,6-mannosyltransferase
MTRAVHEVMRKTKGLVRVHCTHAVPEVVSLLALRRKYGRRLQVICYAHGEEITACCSSRQLKFLMRRAHRIIDLMIANSHYTARLLREHIDPDKIKIVHPGVLLDEFAGAHTVGDALRAKHGWQDRTLVLPIGRLDPRKNHSAVIDAVAKHPNITYIIAGVGREMDRLKAQAQQLDIGDRMIFMGQVDNPTRIAIYGGCDFFAMPAIQDGTDVEGFGMVFLEAAACGKPSICGNTGGQADAVLDGQTGLAVDGADPVQVNDAIIRMATDNPLRTRLGQGALKHAYNFDWPNVVQQTAQLVENIT